MPKDLNAQIKNGPVGLGERLKEYRKAKGLTQAALGEAVGVVQQSVAGWETDRTTLAANNLFAVCLVLEISADALLGLTPSAMRRAPNVVVVDGACAFLCPVTSCTVDSHGVLYTKDGACPFDTTEGL